MLSQLPQYLRGAPPRGRPVVRVRTPAPTTWCIARETLTLAWDGQTRAYDLLTYTVATLVDALQADGGVLEWFEPAHYARGAVTLREGAGTAAAVLEWSVDTTVLHSLTRPVEAALEAISAATPDLAQQVSLDGADADWLDAHGRLYGIARPSGMDDAGYRAYILAAIMRPRNTPRGMEQNLRQLGDGTVVQVREPWQEIVVLSDTAVLSTDQHLQGAPVWQYHTLQLISPSAHDWPRWLEIANADRPAGTLLLDPATQPAGTALVMTGWLSGIAAGRVDRGGALVRVLGDWVLSDNLVLSDSRPPPLWRVSRVEVRGLVTAGLRPAAAVNGWVGSWDQRTWRPLPTYEFYPPLTVLDPAAGQLSDGYYYIPLGADTWVRRVTETAWAIDAAAGVRAPDAPGQAGDWYLAAGYLQLCVAPARWCRLAVESTWTDGPWPADAAERPGDAVWVAPYWYRKVADDAWVRAVMETQFTERPPSRSDLPDAATLPDGATLQVTGGVWAVETASGWVPAGGLPAGADGLPDPAALPDGSTLQVMSGVWMVETLSGWVPTAGLPPNSSGLPDPAALPDGATLQVLGGAWIA